MSITWRELIREFRWVTYGPTAILFGIASLLLAVWGASSGSASIMTAIANFEATLARYKENGEDVAAALASPATVEGDGSQQIITNSLRYDLDQVGVALTQLSPTGAACAILSLCALLAFPIIGFSFGIFMSTHDYRSGSIVVRWPQSGIRSFLFAKPAALVLSMLALAIAVAVLSVPCALVAEALVRGSVSELSAFAAPAPPVDRVVALVALSALTGAAGGAVGLLVGGLTRNRTFTIAIFSVVYLLVPLVGEYDPRNFLAHAGSGAMYFPGDFRPAPLGSLGQTPALLWLLVFTVVAYLLSAVPWMVRSRVARAG